MRRPAYLLGLGAALILAGVFYRTTTPSTDQPPPYATFGGVSLTLEIATSTVMLERGLGEN